MKRKLTELSNEELLQLANKKKSDSIINAVFIGFLIGIAFYSIAKNKIGFVTLIPLFLAYKLVKNSKYDDNEIDNLLKERGLK